MPMMQRYSVDMFPKKTHRIPDVYLLGNPKNARNLLVQQVSQVPQTNKGNSQLPGIASFPMQNDNDTGNDTADNGNGEIQLDLEPRNMSVSASKNFAGESNSLSTVA